MDINLVIAIVAILVSVGSVVAAFQQTRIMRESLQKSLEQNIGDDLAKSLASYLRQPETAPGTVPAAGGEVDPASSPLALILQDFVRTYVARQLGTLQEQSIAPPVAALTERVTTGEERDQRQEQTAQQLTQVVGDLTKRVGGAEQQIRNTKVDVTNQILSDLSKTLATVSSNEHFIQALAEEARTIQTNIEAAEARITAQTSRYADDIGDHGRDLAALHAQLDEVRESINHEMASRVLRLLAEQLLRASQS